MNSIELLGHLVAFPTVSRDSNMALIEFVRDVLSGYGIESQLFVDAAARKANLYATVGPRDVGGVLLSGRNGPRTRSGSWNAMAACTRAVQPT
jgi:acetylornithine deacetylase